MSKLGTKLLLVTANVGSIFEDVSSRLSAFSQGGVALFMHSWHTHNTQYAHDVNKRHNSAWSIVTFQGQGDARLNSNSISSSSWLVSQYGDQVQGPVSCSVLRG